MHPFATFPQILFLGPLLAPLILRLTAGFFILFIGWESWSTPRKWLSPLCTVVGILLVIGLYTQVSAIVAIILLKLNFYMEFCKDKKFTSIQKEFLILYTVIVVILLTLIVTGPGFWAFDLPL